MAAPGGTRSRTCEDARRWTEDGTTLFLGAATALTETDLDRPSGLPGWRRRHLVAHVAANADALVNLVAWSATGVPTPMYASPEARAQGIDRGLQMPAPELLAWLRAASSTLAASMDELSQDQWSRKVVTAQGRTVPATEIPWLRAREVNVHAIDLGSQVSFDDLPEDFLEALEVDVLSRREHVPDVEGVLAQRVAWLTGRPHGLTQASDLGPWL